MNVLPRLGTTDLLQPFPVASLFLTSLHLACSPMARSPSWFVVPFPFEPLVWHVTCSYALIPSANSCQDSPLALHFGFQSHYQPPSCISGDHSALTPAPLYQINPSPKLEITLAGLQMALYLKPLSP